MRSRLFVLNLVFFLFSAAVIVRLFSLQVLSHGYYKNLAENQHQLYKTLIPVRGEILVKENKSGRVVPVVTNVEKDLVFATPPEIPDKDKTAAVLAPILQLPRAELLNKISDPDRKWVALQRELPESVSRQIKNLKLEGIYLQPETYRLHSEKEFASQALGFLAYRGEERVGQYGIEESYEQILAGQAGSLTLDKDAGGRWITGGIRKLQPARDGAQVILTLDRAVQFKAQAILKAAVERHLAEAGSIVILNPKTGAIIAMANYPSFDPNLFRKVTDVAVYRNRAVSDTYEPGSVFKPITLAAALDAEAVTPDLTYEDTGSVALDEFVITNADNKVYGKRTMVQVLEQSINTGAIFVQAKTGREKFLETVEKFGFGSPTGVTLPAEAAGDIQNLLRGGQVHYATASFGQGITVTLLQLARAFGAIAHGGKLLKPYLVESIRYPDGKVETFVAEELGMAISQKAASTLAAMLVSVVENGHGKRARVPGYYIAGKTGTAQIARTDGPGYDPDKTIGTFAGFGPVDDPLFAMAVRIDNPKTVRFAESTAAPAFGEMARFLLNYYQVPPTR